MNSQTAALIDGLRAAAQGAYETTLGMNQIAVLMDKAADELERLGKQEAALRKAAKDDILLGNGYLEVRHIPAEQVVIKTDLSPDKYPLPVIDPGAFDAW